MIVIIAIKMKVNTYNQVYVELDMIKSIGELFHVCMKKCFDLCF